MTPAPGSPPQASLRARPVRACGVLQQGKPARVLLALRIHLADGGILTIADAKAAARGKDQGGDRLPSVLRHRP